MRIRLPITALLIVILSGSHLGGFVVEDVSTRWPQAVNHQLGEIVIYQPRVEGYSDGRLSGASVVSLRIEGAEQPVLGTIWFSCRVFVDRQKEEGLLIDYRVEGGKFFTLPAQTQNKLLDWFSQGLPSRPVAVPLNSLVAAIDSVVEGQPALVAVTRPQPTPPMEDSSDSRDTQPFPADAATETSEEKPVGDPDFRFGSDDSPDQDESVVWAVNYPAPVVVWGAGSSWGHGTWYVPTNSYRSRCTRRCGSCGKCRRHATGRNGLYCDGRRKETHPDSVHRLSSPKRYGLRTTTNPIRTTTERRYTSASTPGYRKSIGVDSIRNTRQRDRSVSSGSSRGRLKTTRPHSSVTPGTREVAQSSARTSISRPGGRRTSLPLSTVRIGGGGGSAMLRRSGNSSR